APARCAAPPAPQMKTLVPLWVASRTNAAACSGVRCADRTRTSTRSPSFLSISAAGFMVSRSDFDPIRIATSLAFVGLMGSLGSPRSDVFPVMHARQPDRLDGAVGLGTGCREIATDAGDTQHAAARAHEMLADAFGAGMEDHHAVPARELAVRAQSFDDVAGP